MAEDKSEKPLGHETIQLSRNTTPEVDAIGRLNLQGNVIPHSWFAHIRTETGAVDLIAIVLLADLIWWYRPTEIRDEVTNELVGFEKKFAADMLQKQYETWGAFFGFSKRQTSDAVDRLIEAGLVRRELRTITTAGGLKLSNVTFFAPIPAKIEEITYRLDKRDRYLPKKRYLSPKNVIPITEKRDTYTENTTETTTERPERGFESTMGPGIHERAEVQPPLLHIKTEKKPAVSSPQVATAPKKREKREKQTKPPPPAVEAFRTVRRRYPRYETWEMIDAAVGQKESDLVFWREVLTQYAAMGWNPNNVIGPLDFFRRRELPSLKRKQPESRYEQLTRVLGLDRIDEREGDNGSTRTDPEDDANVIDPLSFKVAV